MTLFIDTGKIGEGENLRKVLREEQRAATCPGTNHLLFFVSSTHSLGCGYCKRKGGPDELRAFVEDRRTREEQREAQHE